MRMIKLDNSKSASRMPPASLDMYRHSNTQVYCFNTVSKRYKYVSKPYTYAYDRLQHSASKKSWPSNKLHGHHFMNITDTVCTEVLTEPCYIS